MGMDIAAVTAQLELLGEEFLATSPEVREGALEVAKQGRDIAKRLAESELTQSREHTTKGGYVNEPGEYAASIEAISVFKDGTWAGQCRTRNWKADWIEYGTQKWPKHAIMRRARTELAGGNGE